MEKRLSGPMIHICFLEAEKDDNNLRKGRMSATLDEMGLTFEQAENICKELNNHKTIAAWMTGGCVKLIDEEVVEQE